VACRQTKQRQATEGRTNGRKQKELIYIVIKEGNKIRKIKVISSATSEKKRKKKEKWNKGEGKIKET
jgi:hypothetical protein